VHGYVQNVLVERVLTLSLIVKRLRMAGPGGEGAAGVDGLSVVKVLDHRVGGTAMATARPVLILKGHDRVIDKTVRSEQTAWWQELLWVAAAALLGFGITAIFAGWLELSRSWLVLVYATLTAPLFVGYARWARLDLSGLIKHHWVWGIVGAAAVSVFLIVAVTNQDSSARPEGVALAGNLIWFGVVYGLVDALLLNVLPVLATWRALTLCGWTDRWSGRVATGALAVLASVLVTAAYHLGYPEFRGMDLKDPIIGNSIMSIGYVLTQNPLTAIVSHIVMHIAAVLQGAESTVQLPPHY
jgi:hypothetical protein